jgi:hypothetical protein
LATAFFQESGDQAFLSPLPVAELLSVRGGTDATIDRADFWGVLVVRLAGVKAAPPHRPDARRRAALLVDNLIIVVALFIV